MPKYKYAAIDATGKQKKGKLEAASEQEAASQLAAQGMMVTELAMVGGGRSPAAGGAPAAGGKKKGFSFGKVIKHEGLTLFTRQLATLLEAGLPLVRSLEVMIRQEKNPAFKSILVELLDNVRSGSTFSDGLAQHPKVFDRLYVNMIKAGEAGGVLDVVLDRLAMFMEKAMKTKKKVQTAMIYPVVILTVAFLIVGLLLVLVVPEFQQIFKDMLGDAPMPALTQIVIDLSAFMKEQVFLTIIIMVLFVIGIKVALKTPVGRRAIDWVMLNAPKLGDLGSKAAVSRFTRTFGTLLSSGVPILQALVITKETIGNSIIEGALNQVHDRVRDGEPLATPLDQTKVFPTMVTSMIEVGEETGELPTMLNRIADNYDEDVDNAVAGITSIIEPIMIVFLAIVVGTIVIALFLPIVEIMKQLQS